MYIPSTTAALFQPRFEDEHDTAISSWLARLAYFIGCAIVLMHVFNFWRQVVSYIQEIIDNGYAYESNGSVYFDVQVKLCTFVAALLCFISRSRQTNAALLTKVPETESYIVEACAFVFCRDEAICFHFFFPLQHIFIYM